MFGKDKESKEFFEVFQRKQENPTVIPEPVPERKLKNTDDDRKTEKLDWIKDTQSSVKFQTGDKKFRKLFLNEVVLKQEVLIFGALGAVFLSLACFFVGYKISHKNVLDPEVLQKSGVHYKLDGRIKTVPQGREIKAVDLSLKQAPIATVKQKHVAKWTLQIISYSNTKQHLKQATNLAKAIKDMTGYNAFVAKRGKEIVVCAGKFNFKNGSELKKALKDISKLEYEGKKQFASSYPIQIR